MPRRHSSSTSRHKTKKPVKKTAKKPVEKATKKAPEENRRKHRDVTEERPPSHQVRPKSRPDSKPGQKSGREANVKVVKVKLQARNALDQIGYILGQIIDNPVFEGVCFFLATTEGFFNGTISELFPSRQQPVLLRIETTAGEKVHISIDKLIAVHIVDKEVSFTDSRGQLLLNLLAPPANNVDVQEVGSQMAFSNAQEESMRQVLTNYVKSKEKVKLYLLPSTAPQSVLNAVGYGVAFLNDNTFVITSYISAIGPPTEE